MKARNLNKVLAGLIFAGFAASSTVSTLAHASGDPWETGQGLTSELINKNKETFNTYEKSEDLPKISAYLSNWTHYQQGYEPSIDTLSKYDTVILSFFGLCGTEVGDPSITSAVEMLKTNCAAENGKKFELMSTDTWADLQLGFPRAGVSGSSAGWLDSGYGGLMGVMKKLTEESGTKVAVSIFGWSLSNIASDAVKEENRPVLINSLIEFINAYPFVTQLDIDWEYPGIQGASENVFDPENDARNYAEFIAELRTALNDNGSADVKLGIASGAPKDKIDAAELQNLITAGVDTIHLMTYDFFGESWAEGLAHHTNLMANGNSEWSSDTSIRYMIEELGINPQNIQIGYANYSRNAINADMETSSPLKGTFTKGSNVMGSFESAVTGINDTFTNYVEASAANGLTPKNGYHLYTDEHANADFLYHPEEGIFMSLDTPRTVYAKGQYALKHNLGGIFTWMADQDEGLMVNAAREGLGNKLLNSTIDMEKIIYTCGEETTAERCEELTNLNDGGNEVTVNAGADVETEFTLGSSYALSGSVTNADEIKKTVWVVKKTNGIEKSDVLIAKKKKLDTTFSVDLAEAPQQDVTIEFQLKATLNDDSMIKDKVVYTLKKQQPNIVPEIHEITYPATYEMSSGEALTFTADASDSEQNTLIYEWTMSDSSYAIAFDDATNNPAAIDLTTLPNKPEYAFDVNLTVTNLYERADSETVRVTVKGDEDVNEAPVASFNVLTEEPAVNEAVLMESTSTDELPAELTLAWSVTHNGDEVEVRNEGSVNSFVPTEAGDYIVQLEATDVFGATHSTQQSVTVSESSIDVDYVYPDGVGSYVDGTVVKFEGEGIYQCFGAWAANCNDATYNPGGSNQDWIEQQWKKLD